MLYDLNIAWSPNIPAADLEQTLKFSASLGYHVVALNHTLRTPIPQQVLNPIPHLNQPAPPPPPRQKPDKDGSGWQAAFVKTPETATPRRPILPTVLRRATVIVADPAANHGLASVASAYDLLAVRPTTEKAFQAACLTMADAALISLDMAAPLGFHFRPRPCMAAVRRGLRFELCYGQALQLGGGGDLDARRRAAFIGNVAGLVRATRGRGLVVSSGAASALGLRGPADVVNLLAVWGLGPERGTEAIGVNPRAVVVNEGIKRRGYRGVVDVVRGAGEDRGRASGTEVDAGKEETAKRKAGQLDAAKSEVTEQPLSKKQRKKMKRAAAAVPNDPT